MATTLDWLKSLRAEICGDCGKGWNFNGRDVDSEIVMQIDENVENGRSIPQQILVLEKTIRFIV